MPDGTLLQMSLYEADKATEKAEVRTLRCCLDGGPEACPLGQKGQCLGTNLFGGSRCMYGRSGSSFSASKRSKSYAGFVKDAKAKIAALKATGFRSPKEVRLQLLRIGEWVCLPNGQITSCETVPFRAHGGVFRTGSPWLKTEDLTIENLLKLCNFRPHAMMGGEITSYQREEVPNLLLQLKFREPELFAALMAAAPELEAKVPDPSRFVGKELHVTKFPPGTVTLKFGRRARRGCCRPSGTARS